MQNVFYSVCSARTSLFTLYFSAHGAFGLVMGIRGGFGMIVSNVIWAKFYGRLHLGSIIDVTMTLMVASSALDPMPFGVTRDILGSYTVVLFSFAGLPLILAVATLLYCKPPVRP
jgi:hypothetical protein